MASGARVIRRRRGLGALPVEAREQERQTWKARLSASGDTNRRLAVWIRGILQDEHGLDLAKVDWQDVFGGFGRLPDGQPEALSATDHAARHRIDDLLVSGAISATVSAYHPPAFLAGDPSIARLFPDFERVEKAY